MQMCQEKQISVLLCLYFELILQTVDSLVHNHKYVEIVCKTWRVFPHFMLKLAFYSIPEFPLVLSS